MSENNEKESMSVSLPIISRNNTNLSGGGGLPSVIISHSSIKSDSQKSLKNKNLRRQSFMSGNSQTSKMLVGTDQLSRSKAYTSNTNIAERFGGCLNSDSEDNDDAASRDDNDTRDDYSDSLTDDKESDSDVDVISDVSAKQSDLYKIRSTRNKDDPLRTHLQLKLYYFFEEPSSKWARAFEAFSTLCTIITIVFICVISWPTIHPREIPISEEYWEPINVVALIVFTVEYAGRFYASVNKLKFFFKLANLIDLISIVPFYIQLINDPESMFQIFKVLRLLRILKIIRVAKYTAGFHITTRVFQRSAYQIVMVSVYVLVILLASSALMYYIERGDFNGNDMTWYRTGKDGVPEISPFQSIVHSFWWSIVTLTTTGYGDAVPITGPGKLVAALTMTCGILVIALPTSIIGSNFNAEWSLHRRLRFQLKLHQKRERAKEILSNVRQSKAKKIRVLQDQNQTTLLALGEIQQRLAEINPPKYYRKYKKLQAKHMEALNKIAELENKLARLKRIVQNFDTFKDSQKKFDSDPGADKSRSDGWKWKTIPFRNFNSALQRSISDVEDGYKSKHKNLLSPLKTLKKSVTNLTTQSSSKKPVFTKELISSPTELRPSFTPIINSKKVNDARSASDSDLISRKDASEYIGDTKDKSINKDNIEDLSTDNIIDKNTLSTNDTQDDQDDIVRNNKKIDNSQNTESREIEIVVDNQK